jgi:hypothetical protein
MQTTLLTKIEIYNNIPLFYLNQKLTHHFDGILFTDTCVNKIFKMNELDDRDIFVTNSTKKSLSNISPLFIYLLLLLLLLFSGSRIFYRL